MYKVIQMMRGAAIEQNGRIIERVDDACNELNQLKAAIDSALLLLGKAEAGHAAKTLLEGASEKAKAEYWECLQQDEDRP